MATAPTVPQQADVARMAAEPLLRKDPALAAAACLLVVLLAGLLPVWALSVRTPFRLIDDYGASFDLWDKPLREHLASNLLVRDGGIRGVVIHPSGSDFDKIDIHGNEITAGVGAKLKEIAYAARAAGLNAIRRLGARNWPSRCAS